MKAAATISIPRPIEEVFDFVTNVDNMSRWVNGVTSARLVSTAMEKGAHYVLDYVRGWRSADIEIEVVEFDPPSLFAGRTWRGPFEYEGRMELTIEDETTRVTNIIEGSPDSVSSLAASALLGPLMRRAHTRRIQRELEQLRRAIGGQ